MSLATTIDQLKKTLPRAGAAYEAGRSRHPVLSPYDSPSAVLAAVDRGSPLSVIQRDAVLLALLDELRCSPSSVWQSLLVVAFAPMLGRFRARQRRPGCENLDQLVLVAFLEVARSFTARSYVQRTLRLQTKDRLVAAARRDHRASDLELFDDDTYVTSRFGADAHMKAALSEVVIIVEAVGGEVLCDALIARHGTNDSMREYVEREHAQLSSGERAQLCDRLYRAERRALRRVQARVKRGPRYAWAA